MKYLVKPDRELYSARTLTADAQVSVSPYVVKNAVICNIDLGFPHTILVLDPRISFAHSFQHKMRDRNMLIWSLSAYICVHS